MSADVTQLEAKIDEKFKAQEKAYGSLEDAIKDMSQTVSGAMSTVIELTVRSEERHNQQEDFKDNVKQDIRDLRDTVIEHKKDFDTFKREEFQPVRESSQANSLLVNGAVGTVGVIFGIVATIVLNGG